MVNTSPEFYEAIRSDKQQLPLLIFNNGVIMPEDIDISAGIHFQESVVAEEDFIPGICNSASLDLTLINDTGAWSDYLFGEATALLGVETNKRITTISTQECQVVFENTTILTNSSNNTVRCTIFDPDTGYYRISTVNLSSPARAMLLINDKLILFTDNGIEKCTYSATRGLQNLIPFTWFTQSLIQNAEKWKQDRLGIVYGHDVADLTTGVTSKNNLVYFYADRAIAYEMIPLGIFNYERPIFSSRKSINLSGFDRMQKFDKKATDVNFTFPTTLYGLLTQVCTAASLTLANSEITNGSIVIPKKPDFKENTLRDILRFIAEISGDFARITRDGELQLKWFTDTDATVTMYDYSDCDIGYFDVAGINKIVVREYNKDDAVTGTGENEMYIIENPIVKVI